KDGNIVEAEVLSGKYLIYEYRADPEYSFAAADSGFLLGKLESNKKPADTTGAYGRKLRQDVTSKYEIFTGFKF
ncbi:MAG: hypothetical protein Q7U71_10875, partial [bacterium]|nr:hypothetical protein [bacterium]